VFIREHGFDFLQNIAYWPALVTGRQARIKELLKLNIGLQLGDFLFKIVYFSEDIFTPILRNDRYWTLFSKFQDIEQIGGLLR
jgi:hypothetical protein